MPLYESLIYYCHYRLTHYTIDAYFLDISRQKNSKRQIQVTNNNHKKIKLVSNKEMENINKIK